MKNLNFIISVHTTFVTQNSIDVITMKYIFVEITRGTFQICVHIQ